MSIFAKRILFATDLSENSAHALRTAIALAANTGGEIHILHAAEPLTNEQKVVLRMFVQSDSKREESVDMRHAHLKEMLTEWTFEASRAQKQDGTAEAIKSQQVVQGHPAEVILLEAKKLDCDLIAIASHEHNSSFTFLGSVAQRVLRRTEIPTLVIPHRKFTG